MSNNNDVRGPYAGWTRRAPDQRWYRVVGGERTAVMETLARYADCERLVTAAAIDANRTTTAARIIGPGRGDQEG